RLSPFHEACSSERRRGRTPAHDHCPIGAVSSRFDYFFPGAAMSRLTTVLALALSLYPSAARAADKPNIVFILADDLGWTDLGCQGSKYYESPNIDRLASQALRFTSAYTCGPNCQPTRAALISGQYGPRTGVYTVGGIERFDWQSRPLRPVDNVQQLPPSITTFAQALKSAGYSTAPFGKWHLAPQGPYQ